jgi:hypothetical protein
MPGQRAVMSRHDLPANFPTHQHPPEFWEQLGRTIATFGLLEEVLGKAIFAFSATTEYTEEEAKKVLEKWQNQLEHALIDTLYPLAEVYAKLVRVHQDLNFPNLDDLIEDIKKAADWRNVLCHGSWHAPDGYGKTTPFFFNKKLEKFDTPIDLALLKQVQAHLVDLITAVVSSVTHMGWQFPGGAGPGEEIWKK